MKKKLRGLCVCVVSAAMLAACAITTPTAAEPVQEQITETTTAAEETAVSAAEETEAGNVIENNSDLTTIRMFIPLTRSVDADKIQEITDAVNAISESEIGVHVDLVTAEVATFNTSLPLALASGESYDVVQLMPYPPLNLNSMYAANQLMDISPYLEEYGQGILSVTGDYLDAVTINGGVYMVPNVRNYASSLYVLICKEYIDGAGVAEQFENMTTVEDLEAVCEAVYEKYGIPVFAGGQNDDEKYFAHGTNGIIMASTGSFEENSVVYDNLGDSLYCFGTDPDTNSVYSLYESEAFINGCIKAKEWYDKGWLYKDAPFSTEAQSTIVKNGAACGFFVTSELGVEAAKESIVGKPMYAKKLVDAYVTSGVVNRFGLGVPTSASEPEAAVAFMDLLLTNGELNDIFNWGIEGEDWVNVDGEAAYVSDPIWHQVDFFMGNAYLSMPWSGAGADNRIRAKEANDAAPISPYLGFALDTSDLSNEVTAIFSVQSEYLYSMTEGLYDEEEYEAFIEKIKTAGLDKYLESVQEQLNAWISE